MVKIHDEIRSLLASTGRQTIQNALEVRKQAILDEMMGECKLLQNGHDTMPDYALKKLYAQNHLQIQYRYIDYLLSIPQTILNTEIKDDKKPMTERELDNYLSSFDNDELL